LGPMQTVITILVIAAGVILGLWAYAEFVK
jgi:hypothetical protein